MDEENTIPTEEISNFDTQPATLLDETEASASGDGSVIVETTEATEETLSVVTFEAIHAVGSDIVHADLFGSFLICGTLVGIVLWRKLNGT